MAVTRRRSARLASGTVSTPKSTSKLSSLPENEAENVEANDSHMIPSSSRREPPSTPAASSPIKPSLSDMHPGKFRAITAEPSSALRLGFTDINPLARNENNQGSGIGQRTPSKTNGLPSSPFTFRSVRRSSADHGLSSDAQKMMAEIREEAAVIKASMAADLEREKVTDELGQRKIAKPKGRSGRFSAAHMAQFKKMDSIENHVSALRGVTGRTTPASSGIKRSSSRANLDDSEPTSLKPSLKRSHSKPNLNQAPNIARKTGLVSSPSKASLEERPSVLSRKPVPGASVSQRGPVQAREEPPSPAKRAKQRLEDDASSSRPVSRDASFIPRPKSSHGADVKSIAKSQSTLSLLSSPTKSSQAKAVTTVKAPVLTSPFTTSKAQGGLTRSYTTNNLAPATNQAADSRPRLLSPGRIERVKSILRSGKKAARPKSALPLPFSDGPETPAMLRSKPLPPLPMTSPTRNKLAKRPTVEFTPETRYSAFVPSSRPSLRARLTKSKTTHELSYATLDSVLMDRLADEVVYPDLTKHQGYLPVVAKEDDEVVRVLPPSVPGTFTFRSDHTIDFGSVSPTGFGANAGQSSVRHVRHSILPSTEMPGSFPEASPSLPHNKENQPPTSLSSTVGTIPHGLQNKKRHRPSWKEEEQEAEDAQRNAKRQKFEKVPEGDALLAPRLVGITQSSPARMMKPLARAVTQSPSPTKKRPVLSLSRLNMLARPKQRA